MSDKTIDAELQRQANSAAAIAKQLGAQLPAGATADDYSDKLYEKSLADSQLASAYAQESSGWLEKHNGALAVVSILALSLFLLGLALTLGNRPTQLGFTGPGDRDDLGRWCATAAGAGNRHHRTHRGLHQHGGGSQRRHGRVPLRRRGEETEYGTSGLPRVRRGVDPTRERVLLLRRGFEQPTTAKRVVAAGRTGRQVRTRSSRCEDRRALQRPGVHGDPQPSVRRRRTEHGPSAQARSGEPLRAWHSCRARDRSRRREDGDALPRRGRASAEGCRPVLPRPVLLHEPALRQRVFRHRRHHRARRSTHSSPRRASTRRCST